ncbi:hypothetical protein OROGR_023091 [Orobanche gracilis]
MDRFGTFLASYMSLVMYYRRILVFKIRPSQEILKIRDGIPLEKKRVARILVFKIRPSQEILKIRDEKRVARILVFKIRPSQKILKIRDGTPLEAEEILTYKKSLRNGSVWHFSSKLHVPSNVLQKKRVARILVFKIRPSQEILKIRDGIPLEAKEILIYRKSTRNGSVWHFSSKLDVPSNVLQKKSVARILVFKIRSSQEILKIHDGTPLEMPSQEILKIRDEPSQEILKIRDEILKIRDDVPSNVLQKKRVARILVFKIRPSQKILKIRDGTPLEAEEILTYKKSLRNGSVWHFSSKPSQEILKIRDDVPSNVLQKKRVARILVFKIRPSQEILKIRDVARILVFKIRPSQKILKIRDGTPLEAEEILTYKKSLRNGSVWHFSSKLHVPSNVLQKKRVARILVFKIRPSQEILKIRDGIPLEAKEILIYRKSTRNGSVWHFSSKLDVPSNVLQKKSVARILVFKIRSSQEILKIHDGTPLEKKRVARILVFKIRPSQEILKIRDGTTLEAEKKRVARILVFKIRPSQEILKIRDVNKRKKRVARILVFKIRPSQKILKIRDGTPLEAEEILTYKKSLRNGSVWHFSSKLHVPSNVLQKKTVARILVFKIRPSQEILKIRDGIPLEKKRVARILVFKNRPSQEILKIRDGTPLEKKRVARIMVFKIRPSQNILKIRDGTPLEAEEILTYKKSLRNGSVWHFSSKLHVPSNVLQKKRVARILVFKIRPSQEILKIRDGIPLEAKEILIYRKKVARILVFKIRPSQEILKIRDV